ncbi:MAG: class I tRNA ligase family protein, partial [Clostridia bacterium]|nr:class I tRNA ligase family protein [Clostridia bacterium]
VEASRNFANKLWNAARFILMNLQSDELPALLPERFALEDKWILSQYNRLVVGVTENLDRFELGMAVQKLYDFIWDVFCDWYIEICKSRLNGDDAQAADTARGVLLFVFTGVLKLLHPFMPFITEEIWQSMPHEGEALMIESWPVFDFSLEFEKEESDFEKIMAVIRAVRNRRAEMNVPPSKKASLHIETKFPDVFRAGTAYLCRLAYASEIEVGEQFDSSGAVRVITDAATVYMPMKELVDLDAELARLEKELDKARRDQTFFENKLNNPGFVSKAPAAVVETQRAQLNKVLEKIAMLENSLKEMQSL